MGLASALVACDRGRGRGWIGAHGVGGISPTSSGGLPLEVTDCPDGLARCEEGTVSVSRLATLPMPCQGPASACACPWEVAAACSGGCVAEGLELVVERAKAASQLCAPGPGAGGGVFAASLSPPASGTSRASSAPDGGTSQVSAAPDASDAPCDEGDRYRCSSGRVIDCAAGLAVGRCVRGCFAEGTSIEDDGVSREAAFAILCSR